MDYILENKDKFIDAYISNNLSSQEREDFERHLFECNDTFKELSLKQTLIPLIKEEGHELFSEFIYDKPQIRVWLNIKEFFELSFLKPRILVPVAAFSFLFIVGLMLIDFKGEDKTMQTAMDAKELVTPGDKVFVNTDSPNVKANVEVIESVEIINNRQENSNLIAANFEPCITFESLIDQARRNTVHINIKSPSEGQTFKNEKVRFSWESSVTKTLYLKIYDNKENEVFSTKVAGDKYINSYKLAPGLYYWKLETENKNLVLNKFIVK